jgi:hypothetical protein
MSIRCSTSFSGRTTPLQSINAVIKTKITSAVKNALPVLVNFSDIGNNEGAEQPAKRPVSLLWQPINRT